MTITRKQKWEEKQLSGWFKRLINNISHEKTWMWLREGNFKRETESLLIATQNNAMRTNHIKARIDNTQHKSKYRLCGDRDDTMNHIISECSKLAQKKYKTRHDWVGKKFKFDHTNKWYMHNPASVQENDTHKLLLYFDIHTDHLISARRPDLIMIIKKNLQKSGLCCPGWPQNKTESKWKKRWVHLALQGNWKNYATWWWQLYQLWLVLLVRSPKDYLREVGGQVETI